MRRWLFAMLAAAAVPALIAGQQAANAASGGTLPIQLQRYTSDLPHDPYYPDGSAIHIGVAAGQETYRAFLRVDLSSVASNGATPDVKLKLVPIAPTANTNDATANANETNASLVACPLKQPIPASWDGADSSKAPAYDCDVTKATTTPQSDGTVVFDLAKLVPVWRDSANYGAVILPDTSTGATWSAGFDVFQTQATYAVPAAASGGSTGYVPPPVPAPLPAPAPAAAPPLAPLQAAPPPSKPVQAPAANPAAPRLPAHYVKIPVPRPGGLPLWAWTLIAAGAAAVAAGAFAYGRYTAGGGVRVPGPSSRPSALGGPVPLSLAVQTPLALVMIGAVIAFGFATPAVTKLAGGAGSSSAAGSSTAPGGAASAGSQGGAPTAGSGASGTTVASSGASGASGPPSAGGNFDVVLGDVQVNSQQNTAANEFGLTPLYAAGSPNAARDAVTAYVNATGGLAGHKVVWKTATVNDSGSPESNYNEGCTILTEDYHVFAAYLLYVNNDFSNEDCFARHHTLVMDTSYYNGDAEYYRTVAPYVFSLEYPTADRVASIQVDGLRQAGFYSDPNLKLGVLLADEPEYNRVYNNVLVPRLQHLGVNVADVYKLTPGDASTQADGQIISQMNAAVSRWEVMGINHVIFVGGAVEGTAANMAAFFMLEAEKQHYNPRYGLTSVDGLFALSSEIPDDQLVNSVAVGFLPYVDTYDAFYYPWPHTPAEQRCFSIAKKAGQQQSSRYNNAAMLFYCDYLLSLQQAAQGLTGASLTREALAANLQHLGVFAGVIPAGASFRPGYFDDSSVYRILKWNDSCGCASSYNADGNGNTFVYVDKNAVYSIPYPE